MSKRVVQIERKTKETEISVVLEVSSRGTVSIQTGIPFFEHLLHAMAFHGGFNLSIDAKGDTEVDPHHLVEDTGLVLGDAFNKILTSFGPVARFGHSVIPMDEALSEVTIDVSGRPYLVYQAVFPQDVSGTFRMALIREFFVGFANKAFLTLHAVCKYGENSHHMAESLFKAFGKALGAAYAEKPKDEEMSTKGVI